MNYTTITNTVTYINKGNRIIKLEKYCPICNNLFCLERYKEDIYSEQEDEDII